jgi:endogenous inhibitor of DNA gyrase (YacG/DUF329 family)
MSYLYKREDCVLRDISERVSYLQGLSEGLNVSDNSPQGKVIAGILGVLEDVTNSLTDLRTDVEDLKDYIECIDDDLTDLEEQIDDEDRIELDCPDCGERVYFSADVLDDDDMVEVICPSCNAVVYVNDGSFDFEPAFIEEDYDYDGDEEEITEH